MQDFYFEYFHIVVLVLSTSSTPAEMSFDKLQVQIDKYSSTYDQHAN